ncbi:hypothetical protein QTN25_003479 [Entamoeba marina]
MKTTPLKRLPLISSPLKRTLSTIDLDSDMEFTTDSYDALINTDLISVTPSSSSSPSIDDISDECNTLMLEYEKVIELLENATTCLQEVTKEKKEAKEKLLLMKDDMDEKNMKLKKSINKQKELVDDLIKEKRAHAESLRQVEDHSSCGKSNRSLYSFEVKDGELNIIPFISLREETKERDLLFEKTVELQRKLKSLELEQRAKQQVIKKENKMLKSFSKDFLEKQALNVGFDLNDKETIVNFFKNREMDVEGVYDLLKKSEHFNVPLNNVRLPKRVLFDTNCDMFSLPEETLRNYLYNQDHSPWGNRRNQLIVQKASPILKKTSSILQTSADLEYLRTTQLNFEEDSINEQDNDKTVNEIIEKGSAEEHNENKLIDVEIKKVEPPLNEINEEVKNVEYTKNNNKGIQEKVYEEDGADSIQPQLGTLDYIERHILPQCEEVIVEE